VCSSDLLRRYGLEHLLRRLLWLPLLAGLMLALVSGLSRGVPPLPLLLAGTLGFASSLGAIGADTTALALREQAEAAGTAASLLFTLQCLLIAIASLILSLLPGPGALPMSAVMAVCGLLCFVAGRSAARTGTSPGSPTAIRATALGTSA
jgi:DHA1 family bicyclomycin/chloramphenicol resistance-like MFS transporter